MMSSETGRGLEPGRAVSSAGDDKEGELLWLLGLIRLRWKMIAIIAALMIVSAAVVLSQMTTLYSATAEVLIDAQQAQYADLSASSSSRDQTVWPAELETYVKIVWSDQLASDVVKSFGPGAFEEPPSLRDRMPVWLHGVVNSAASWLDGIVQAGGGDVIDDAVPEQADSSESQIEREVRVFHRNLEVERDSLAATLYITYRAPDADFAAEVANATAKAFPNELVRSQKATLAATTAYMGERVEALGHELEQAETEMRGLQNEISTVDGQSVPERRLGDLIRAVSEAEADVVQAKADVARMDEETGQLSEGLVSDVLADLQQEERELGYEVAEKAVTLGQHHPTLQALQARQARVRASIGAEEDRLRGQIRAGLEKREWRLSELRQQLADVETQLALNMDEQVRLKQLATRVESTRQIYQDILTRYQRAREQQLLLTPRARVISVAQPPQAPERRKQQLLFAAVALGSVPLGAGLALLLELRRKGFSASDELARETGLPVVGVLPSTRIASGALHAAAARRLGLHVSANSRAAKVILVASALPGDGKTTVSLSLARQLANSGQETLVIDADLRKLGLKNVVTPKVVPSADLTTLLSSKQLQMSSAIAHDTCSDVDFILALDSAVNPDRLLASPRLAEMLREARTRYDAIILDTPPVLATAEALLLATLADQVLLVVRSGDTPRRAVTVALRELRATSTSPIGLVLNGINLRNYARGTAADHLAFYKQNKKYLAT